MTLNHSHYSTNDR